VLAVIPGQALQFLVRVVAGRQPGGSGTAAPDRRSSRQGAPSTISAGAAMANTTNCADSATTYRWASPVMPSAATTRAAPAAASQGLPRGTAGGAACCCLMGLSRTAGPGGAASGGRARRWPLRRLALAMIVAIITLFADQRHNHQQNERAMP
jgi:hypothetical protein